MKAFDQDLIRSLSDSALWISVFAVYIADRHSTKQQTIYPYSSMHSFSGTWNFFPVGVDPDNRDKHTVDKMLETFQQAVSCHCQGSPLLLVVNKFSLILRLLRFIRYRLLYVSSSWMAQRQEVKAAAEHIA